MKQVITQAAEQAGSSPKVAQLVATTTAGLGAAEVADLLKDWIGVAAMTAGLCLSGMIIIKTRYDLRVAVARREEEVLEREESGLPVRRLSDKV